MTAEPLPSQTNTPSQTLRNPFRSDLIANFAGQGWAAVIQLIFIPLYIRFLGIEAYGLVGLYLVIFTIGRVVDFGLSPTITRELARRSVIPGTAAESRDLVKTLQSIYWILGLSIGGAVILLAWLITSYWLGPSSLAPGDVHSAIMAMGILLAFQWPLAFYQGALMGLQRQVLMISVRATASTVSAVGAVLVLWLVSPTVMAYFTWQIAVNLIHVSLLAVLVWRSLPRCDRAPRFRLTIIKELWKFAAGTSVIMALGIVLSQSDKLVVSKFLSLREFAYYSVASTAVTGLFLFIHPVYNSLYPRLSSLVALGDEGGLRLHYRRGIEIVGILVFSASALLIAFAPDILRIWTRDPLIAENGAWILRFLAAGTALNGPMYIPLALQLAVGWTSIGIRMNLFLLLTMIPLWIIMAIGHGAAGAASVWLILNVVQVLVVIPLMHRRVLRGEALKILLSDFGLPILVAACLVGGARLAIPEQTPSALLVAGILFPFVLSAAALGMVSPYMRGWLLGKIRKERG